MTSKKQYVRPKFEAIEFTVKDIILTSIICRPHCNPNTGCPTEQYLMDDDIIN
ncbi:MAG: hypothetical protein Q4E88_00285 [Coriobacteriia bacterium]|nr:hypothetical protein [Coriobacteriia bacterium]